MHSDAFVVDVGARQTEIVGQLGLDLARLEGESGRQTRTEGCCAQHGFEQELLENDGVNCKLDLRSC